ncbi:FAD-dependent oxidoreductase [Yinghuangia aomiensis]|uniref:D-amino-acid oxidase n=1 Tax=Yinghuangia aomiensis TaxID=676205 RepID=A0ABP9HUV4_9ACTN
MELLTAQPEGSVDAVVIGAGIIGLSSAVSLAEAGLRVRVDSAVPPGKSTSFAAGAVWDPYLVQPHERVAGWARTTLRELTRIAGQGPHTGVRIRAGSQQSRLPCDLPYWAEAVSARWCEPRELKDGFVMGWPYQAPVADMGVYLDHLVRRLTDVGGRMRLHTYRSLAEAADEAPVVVNCSGAGARTLVPDPDVRPVQGHLVIVENPGIDSFFCDDTPGTTEYTYIYPHGPTVALGGSQKPDEWSTAPDPEVVRVIIERCAAVEPALRDARVVGCRVGLRPTRREVCLREDSVAVGRLLHNYGHGGAGFSLSWGCAEEITAMVLGEGSQEATISPS